MVGHQTLKKHPRGCSMHGRRCGSAIMPHSLSFALEPMLLELERSVATGCGWRWRSFLAAWLAR